ncbi:MAG TPA: tripartite tricarboxylate transporter substrate-binding protein [Ramlibacter sp.]|nr:tripartite tricarboxylate transporter substrate-binding protein [Ramlibacter sp.]
MIARLSQALSSALLAAVFVASAAAQQPYPSKPIRMVVPAAAGSSTDAPARMLAESLKTTLGQPVVVDNRAGAGGMLGVMATVRSAPDGYNLLFTASSPTIQQALNKGGDFDMRRDLVPIAIVAQGVLGLFVHPSLPVKTPAELVAYAKARPGKLNYGSAGIGSTNHLVTEHFKSLVGIDIVHVPYAVAQTLLVDAATNQVQLLMHDVAYMRPQVAAGRVRMIGVATQKPSVLAPDTPTIGGHDGIPSFEGTFFFGVFAPAGTPQPVVDTLYKHIETWAQAPATRSKLIEMGYEPLLENPEGTRKRVAAMIERFTKVVERAGINK